MSTFSNEDQNRYRNHRDRFLAMLQGGDWIPFSSFAAISRNVTARIAELRELGYQIEIEVLEDRDTRYRLTGQGDPVAVDHLARLKSYVKSRWDKLGTNDKDDFCDWLNEFVTEEVA